MPEGDPEDCVGEEAELAAAYIYDAFYSPIAQIRNRPPRRELSRLTVRQYQQTIADLLQTFRPAPSPTSDRGLTARFYRGRRPRESRVLTRRVDPTLDFQLQGSGVLPPEIIAPPPSAALPSVVQQLADLEAKKPFDKKQKASFQKLREKKRALDAEQFRKRRAICRWTGGLSVDRTGEYELIVDSPAGLELNFNGVKRLIDARVRSQGDVRRRATVRLIEGRSYPIDLLVNREGEDDLPVVLRWLPPGGVEEVIPSRFLTPHWRPPVTVVSTRFPPDDHSTGYVRGASVSEAWTNAVAQGSLEVAKEIVSRLPELLEVEGGLEAPRFEQREFLREFAERAFRRPLAPWERQEFADKWFDSEPTNEEAVMKGALAVLSSPRFLYPELGTAGAAVDYHNASRLALALWDSLPDRKLLRAARHGELRTREQLASQAERMLEDPRTRTKLNEFFRIWLHVDQDNELTRDQAAFPDFDPSVANDMRTSFDLFLDRVVWEGEGDFRQLFLARELFVNEKLAGFLGIESQSSEGFWIAPPDTEERSGVVTHPYLVATLAYSRETSPIHRGVFLARNLLGRTLRPPPVSVAPLGPELEPDLTTRERVALQTSPSACQGCHVMINHLGFTLEHFDAVGRFRNAEAGQPVDTSGFYVGLNGQKTKFRGARDLAQFLASSEDVYRAFVTQLFEHTAKQPAPAYGSETVDKLLTVFKESDYNIRHTLVESAVVATLLNEPTQETEPSQETDN